MNIKDKSNMYIHIIIHIANLKNCMLLILIHVPSQY